MKTKFDSNVTVIEDFLDNLSDRYSSLEDYRRNGAGMGPIGMANIDKIKNVVPPAEYQRRLIANTNVDPSSKFYKVEYPDTKRTVSAQDVLNDELKDVTFINKINNVDAGIPPVQVNKNIKLPNLDSVKMNDFGDKNQMSMKPQMKENTAPTMGYRHRNLGCGCVDSMNHMRMCPVCARFQNYEKNMYMVIIVMIILIASIVVYFLMKDIRQLKSLLKK